jgi:hypothetical protein
MHRFQDQSPLSSFGTTTSPIQATYTAGQTISITIKLNVNHGGRFGFKLCTRRTNLDQTCFNTHQLLRADTGSPFFYILTGSWSAQSATNPQVRLSFRWYIFHSLNGHTPWLHITMLASTQKIRHQPAQA